MPKYDIIQTNAEIDRLLETTTNPRHRFLLLAYYRHRYLEMAGRYEEIFAPDMTVEHPVYHFNYSGISSEIVGRENIMNLYRTWADTNQTAFYVDEEEIAVADHYVTSVTAAHQQVWGRSLTLNRILSHLPQFLSDPILKRILKVKGNKADPDAMYLYSSKVQMIWHYDDRGRLIGEDVWEVEPRNAKITKLSSADVVTTAQAAERLKPLIKPLPSFDEMVKGRPNYAPA